jgi:phage-related baseplate assembly protein
VSQEYRGREAIFDLFRATRRLTDGTYLSELRWAIADDEHAVAVYRARGARLGRTLDIDQVLLIAHVNGVWTDVTALPTDPAAFAEFWA